MKVDIIMPAYNPGNEIIDAINSCLNQSYKNIYITVIDDSSTKNWDHIKKRFPQVKFLTTPQNLGPSGSRNFGIQNTDGEFVSFLDHDDIMHRNKIKKSIEEFQKEPEIGMTCGNYQIFVNRKSLRPPFYRKPIDINWNILMKRNYVASGSVTVKRSVLDNVGIFDENLWIAEDYDLWIRIAEQYPLKYIHDVLYYYSIIPGNDSLTQRQDIQKNHEYNLVKIKERSLERINGQK